MTTLPCSLCGEPVNTKAIGTCRRVIGWEVTRTQGGANYIKKRIPTKDWAHASCVDGVPVHENQMTLEELIDR